MCFFFEPSHLLVFSLYPILVLLKLLFNFSLNDNLVFLDSVHLFYFLVHFNFLVPLLIFPVVVNLFLLLDDMLYMLLPLLPVFLLLHAPNKLHPVALLIFDVQRISNPV